MKFCIDQMAKTSANKSCGAGGECVRGSKSLVGCWKGAHCVVISLGKQFKCMSENWEVFPPVCQR